MAASQWNHQRAALMMLLTAILLAIPINSLSLQNKAASNRRLLPIITAVSDVSSTSACSGDTNNVDEDDVDDDDDGINASSRRHAFGMLASLALSGSSILSTSIQPAIAEDTFNTDTTAHPPTTTTPAEDTNPPFVVALSIQLDKDTTGDIEIEVDPSWAPIAAARFQELVNVGFYNDARFFRVLPGYIAQFGIASDPALNKEWLVCGSPEEQQRGLRCKPLQDEPRKQPNKKGTLSFASAGRNTRQTQVFINLNNNDGIPNFLDAQGFVPFARVTKGMDTVVNKLNSEYGLMESVSAGLTGSVNQGKAAYYGKEYLDALFPKLSYIKSIKII